MPKSTRRVPDRADPDKAVAAEEDLALPPPPKVMRFRFRLRAVDPLRLPPYAGSAWRGLLGHGLRRTACVTRQPVCDGCLLRHNCVYSTLFESPAPNTTTPGRYRTLPHPFVLDVDPLSERDIAQGANTSLGINLIGPALAHLPYLIHALGVAGNRGFGRDGGRFEVTALDAEPILGSSEWQRVFDASHGEYEAPHTNDSPPAVPPAPTSVRLWLKTPLRIKRHGRFVGASEFEISDLLRNLCSRLALLAEHYGGDHGAFDWRRLRDGAEAVQLDYRELHWQEWTRFSSRQNTPMQMGGLLGAIVLTGPQLSTFWPALWYGQWIHAGKGTSFGLGSYRLEVP